MSATRSPAAAQINNGPVPPDGIYRITPSLLDEVEAVFQTYMGEPLPSIQASTADPFAGLRDHALGWAVGHLRQRFGAGSRLDMEHGPTSNAALHVVGFLHFAATWSGHGLFPAMAATAGERGFSLHGLAPFAAAHCLTMMGNQVVFPEPRGESGRIGVFQMKTRAGWAAVHCQAFERFDYPFGRRWDRVSLRAAVNDVVTRAQGRINLRNPGALILSPGAALSGFDDALNKTIEEAMPVQGRKNRGLMTVATVVLRLKSLPAPHTVQFAYGCFPTVNRHYHLDKSARTGG